SRAVQSFSSSNRSQIFPVHISNRYVSAFVFIWFVNYDMCSRPAFIFNDRTVGKDWFDDRAGLSEIISRSEVQIPSCEISPATDCNNFSCLCVEHGHSCLHFL